MADNLCRLPGGTGPIDEAEQLKATTLREYTLDTLAIHGGQAPDPATGSRAVPIYQTTSYVFTDTEHARQLFALEEAGNIYSRIGNPTVDVFEKRIAQMEGGVAAVATASGQAALTAAVFGVAGAGDEIVASMHLYGGTYTLFAHTLAQVGITVKFVDPSNPDNFRRAMTERTKAVVGEIIGNPKLSVLDVETVAKIAHDAGVPLIIDNTFATPMLCRPIEWGADIPEPVDVVQVFRATAHAPGVAKEAANLKEKPVFWLQEGIVSQEAAEIAAGAGLPVVMNRCLWKEVQRLQGSIATYVSARDDG